VGAAGQHRVLGGQPPGAFSLGLAVIGGAYPGRHGVFVHGGAQHARAPDLHEHAAVRMLRKPAREFDGANLSGFAFVVACHQAASRYETETIQWTASTRALPRPVATPQFKPLGGTQTSWGLATMNSCPSNNRITKGLKGTALANWRIVLASKGLHPGTANPCHGRHSVADPGDNRAD